MHRLDSGGPSSGKTILGLTALTLALTASQGTNASGERQRPGVVVPWATSGAGPQAEPKAPAVGHFADTRPNVILLMADDMGWAQTGYYGYPHMKTPNLDDMAASGLRMDRFYAGAPSCTPTRASVMTGRTNDRTGGFRVGHAINKQEQMLSTAFRDAGYSTAHFGKWHLNEAAPSDHPLPTDDPHHPGELGFATG